MFWQIVNFKNIKGFDKNFKRFFKLKMSVLKLLKF